VRRDEIACGLVRVTVSVTVDATLWFASPTWSYFTEHARRVPLVVVNRPYSSSRRRR
jgi:hypothetical protein